MTMYERKVGAFELAVGLAVTEFAVGSGPRAIIFAGLACGLYFAKKHFGGEFSLADLRGLFTEKENRT